MTLKEFDKKYKINGSRRYRLSAKKMAVQMIESKEDMFEGMINSKDFLKLIKMTGYKDWLVERSQLATVVQGTKPCLPKEVRS